MAKSKKPRKPLVMISPIDRLVMNQKVGASDAELIALPVLIHFDIAHRGQGDANCANFLTKHILIALTLGSKSGNRAFYDVASAAYETLAKACARPTDLLSFTTGEYQSMRRWIGAYLRVLPSVSVGMMNFACANANEIISNLDKEAA